MQQLDRLFPSYAPFYCTAEKRGNTRAMILFNGWAANKHERTVVVYSTLSPLSAPVAAKMVIGDHLSAEETKTNIECRRKLRLYEAKQRTLIEKLPIDHPGRIPLPMCWRFAPLDGTVVTTATITTASESTIAAPLSNDATAASVSLPAPPAAANVAVAVAAAAAAPPAAAAVVQLVPEAPKAPLQAVAAAPAKANGSRQSKGVKRKNQALATLAAVVDSTVAAPVASAAKKARTAVPQSIGAAAAATARKRRHSKTKVQKKDSDEEEEEEEEEEEKEEEEEEEKDSEDEQVEEKVRSRGRKHKKAHIVSSRSSSKKDRSSIVPSVAPVQSKKAVRSTAIVAAASQSVSLAAAARGLTSMAKGPAAATPTIPSSTQSAGATSLRVTRRSSTKLGVELAASSPSLSTHSIPGVDNIRVGQQSAKADGATATNQQQLTVKSTCAVEDISPAVAAPLSPTSPAAPLATAAAAATAAATASTNAISSSPSESVPVDPSAEANELYLVGCQHFNGTGVNGVINKAEAASCFERAVVLNRHPKALLALSDQYLNGDGVVQNKRIALNLLLEASKCSENCSSMEALFRGGILFLNGAGHDIPVNWNKGVDLLQQAAKGGHLSALDKLGCIFRDGTNGRTVDKDQAIVYFQQAADGGSSDAQCNLGRMFVQIAHKSTDQVRATDLYEKAIKLYEAASGGVKGDAKAACNLGNLHRAGEGTPVDPARAFSLFQRAVSLDPTAAAPLINMGIMWQSGQLGCVDHKRAIPLLMQAAALNNPAAHYYLFLSFQGLDDVKQALEHLEQGVTLKQSACQYHLGCFHRDGTGGVKLDIPKAAELFEQAALQGNVDAQLNLGNLLRLGAGGVTVNLAEAAKLYEQAAQGGLPLAHYYLAIMLEKGEGVPRSVIKAMEHYEHAVVSGMANAQYGLALILAGLTSESSQEVTLDKPRAFELFTLASAQNHLLAQCKLARILETGYTSSSGNLVPMDKIKAFEMYQALSQRDLDELVVAYGDSARRCMAEMLYDFAGLLYQADGVSVEGVPQDKGRAVKIYEQASQLGFSAAQYQLGLLLVNGNAAAGVAKDPAKALVAFEQAAEQGHCLSQLEAGKLLLTGADGVPQHTNNALARLQQAAKQGNLAAQALFTEHNQFEM